MSTGSNRAGEDAIPGGIDSCKATPGSMCALAHAAEKRHGAESRFATAMRPGPRDKIRAAAPSRRTCCHVDAALI